VNTGFTQVAPPAHRSDRKGEDTWIVVRTGLLTWTRPGSLDGENRTTLLQIGYQVRGSISMPQSLRRIAMLTSRYPAISHTFIWRDVISLRKQGLEVHTCSLNKPGESDLLTEEYRGEFLGTFYIKGVSPAAIALAHLNRMFRSPARYLSSLYFAIRTQRGGIKKLLYNVFYFVEGGILAHWAQCKGIEHIFVHFAHASAAAMYASKMGGPSYSIRVHGSDIFYDCPGHYLKEKFAGATALVCISDFCRSQVLCMLPPEQWSKVSVVRCGLDPELFLPQRQRPNDAQETVVFLCVARLLRAKGLHFLLHACQALRKKGIQLKCILVGDGPAREELERLTDQLGLRACVEFAGAVGQDRIQEYYDKADAFVLPSFAEGVPVVLMEAMSKEIPVITTQIMGIPELVNDGVNGLLVPPANEEALVHAMLRLAADPPLRRRLGQAGRKRVIAEYNQEINVPQLAPILQHVTARKPAPKTAPIGIAEEL